MHGASKRGGRVSCWGLIVGGVRGNAVVGPAMSAPCGVLGEKVDSVRGFPQGMHGWGWPELEPGGEFGVVAGASYPQAVPHPVSTAVEILGKVGFLGRMNGER